MDAPLSILLKEKGNTIHTVSAETSVTECLDKMVKFHIGAVLVTQDGALLGVFTERDVLKKIVNQGFDLDNTQVKNVMTTAVITVTPSTTIMEAMGMMTNNRFRHLPVVEDNKLIGIVSIGDATRWVVESQAEEINNLKQYISS